MRTNDLLRRDFLRVGSLGVAGAFPVLASPSTASAQNAPTAAPELGVFNVRTHGALGDGKTLDTACHQSRHRRSSRGRRRSGPLSRRRLSHLLHPSQEQRAPTPRAGRYHPRRRVAQTRRRHRLQRRRLRCRPNPTRRGSPIRTTATTTGTTPSSGVKTFTTSRITGPGLIYGKGLSFGGDAPPAATIPSTSPSRPASATKPSPSRTAATSCCATSPSSRADTSACCSPASTTSPSTTSPSTPIATAWTSTAARTCASPTAPSTRHGTTPSCPKSSYALGYARPTRNITITNCFVTGCYQLGTVLDGTFKQFPPAARLRHRPHQVRHRVQRRIHQHCHLQLRLRGLPGLRARNRRRRTA